MKTQRERDAERRQARLEDVERQVRSGSLVIRMMTEEERRRYPPPAAERPPRRPRFSR